jgi:hypothetical protein
MNDTLAGLIERSHASEDTLEKQAASFRHLLAGSGAFRDKNLIRIIASHPGGFCDVYGESRTGFHRPVSPFDSTARNRESARLLEAAKDARTSIVVRNVMRFQPGLQRLVERLYAELQDGFAEFDARKLTADLLITHPAAPVAEFRCPAPGILWQIRGLQRVWVSTEDEGLAGDQPAVDLQAGEAVTLPLNWRFEVDRRDGLNVVLFTRHLTSRQIRRARVLWANRLLRNSLRLPCQSTRTTGLGYLAKSSVYFGWRAVQRLRPRFARP